MKDNVKKSLVRSSRVSDRYNGIVDKGAKSWKSISNVIETTNNIPKYIILLKTSCIYRNSSYVIEGLNRM